MIVRNHVSSIFGSCRREHIYIYIYIHMCVCVRARARVCVCVCVYGPIQTKVKFCWQVSILNTKFALNRVTSVGRRTVRKNVYMIYTFGYIVQIMRKRCCCTGDFVLIQPAAASDVCPSSSYAPSAWIVTFLVHPWIWVILCGVDCLTSVPLSKTLQCRVILSVMNDRLERIWKEAVAVEARYCRRNLPDGNDESLTKGQSW
jgi:hypothetical protein